MKKYLAIPVLILALATTAYAGVFDTVRGWFVQDKNLGVGETINRLDQWTSTTSPITSITQRVMNTPVRISGLTAGECVEVTTGGVLTTSGAACGTGTGGGGSGGTWSTTTSQVTGEFVNFPNNNDDIVAIGSNSTTTAEFWFDPTALLAVFRGSLLVNNASSTISNLFIVNSTSTNATTTTLAISGLTSELLKVDGLGVVREAASGVDYEVPVTAGDGLTRTVNDFDCDTANSTTLGCLLAADWSIFNNKISSSSLSAVLPLSYNSGTGAFTLGTVDISANTNLTAGTNITLTGDDLSVDDSFILNTGDVGTGSYTFPYASSTAITVSGVASTSKLFADGLVACDPTTGKLLWSGGSFLCGTDQTSAGGGNSKWATTSDATVITPNGATGLLVTRATTTNATTTTLTVSGLTDALVKADALGVLREATGDADYQIPLTFGDGLTRTVNDVDCDIATGSVFGCLASADWTIFNNKISSSSLSATAPLTYTAATGVFTLGIVPATLGGTGWENLQANTVLLGNGTSRIATTTAGTNGQVLALVGGVPSWVATTTFSAPLTYSAGNVTLGTVDISANTNLTAGTNITLTGDDLSVDDAFILNTGDIGTGNYTFPFASSTALTVSGVASTSKLFADGLQTCDATTGKITWAGGIFGCGTDFNTGGASFGESWSLLSSTVLAPTSSVSILVNHATSTITNLVMVNATTTNATTTSFTISGLTSELLKADALGVIREATADADYQVPLTFGDGLTRTVNDIDCDIASGSVFGCLSTTDWTTFNGKLSLYDAWTHPSAGISATTSSILVNNATSTINNLSMVKSTSTSATTTNQTISSLTSALVQADGLGVLREYAGTTCTNQFVRALSALGIATCESVSLTADVTGILPAANGGSGSATLGQGWLHTTGAGAIFTASTSPTVNYIIATSTTFASKFTFASSTAFTVSGTTYLNSLLMNSKVIPENFYASFTYSTSTAFTGTTTVALGPAPLAETWANIKCFTDVGTVNVSVSDGTNKMEMLQASTTVGTFGFATNNAFTASEKRYVDLGTPASSPTTVSCTVGKYYTP